MARDDQYGGYGALADALGKTDMSLADKGLGIATGLGIGKGISQISNPIGVAYSIGKNIANMTPQQQAAQVMGKNFGLVDVVNTVNPFGITNVDKLAKDLDVDKSGNLSPMEISHGIGYGYGNVHDVKSSISPFGPGTNVTDPKSYTYSKSKAESIGAGIGSGVGATGDLGGSKGAGYSGSKGIGLGFGRAEGVDPGQSSQTGAQTSHSGQGISFSDDAASSSDSSTYICTALYEMGDMKKYIYKYDQIYGKRVDPNVYKGYCVWGKYVATKMRSKGIVYKIAKPLALAWAKQMAYDLSKGRYGKSNKIVKVISKVGEGVCYALGIISNIKQLKGEKYG